MNIWNTIASQLQTQNHLILLVVVSHKGSSPGRQGFKMIVTQNGELFGSIGGGRTEFQLANQAKDMLKNGNLDSFFVNQVHRNKDKDSSGMICTGEQLVLFFPIHQSDLDIINQINLLKTAYSLTPNGIKLVDTLRPSNQYTFNKTDENNWSFIENLNSKPKAYIFGGGHVGLATSKLLADLDFNVTVFECRNNINTFDDNNFAHTKSIIDYNHVKGLITESEQSYVILVTHGYITDELILKQLLHQPFKYIGMMGSKAKIKQTFRSIVSNGFSRSDLETIHSPIGLPIKSQTPTEIAVSICAEIVKVKNAEK